MKEPVTDNLTPNTRQLRNNSMLHIWIGSLITLGLLVTFFSQSLAYFVHSLNDSYYLATYLTVFSGLALALLLSSLVFVIWQAIKKRFSETEISIYVLISVILVVPAIGWTVFVTAMWWG